MPYIEVRDVKARAEGQWDRILATLAPNLSEALERPGRHVPCPVHGGKDGFRLLRKYKDLGSGVCNTCGVFPDGFSLLVWAKDYQFKDALSEVAEIVGLGDGKAQIRPVRPAPKPVVVNTKDEDDSIRKRLRWVYRTALPLRSPGAEAGRLYLRSRGLTLVPGVLRLHPGLHYRNADGIRSGPFPTLISPLVDAQRRGVSIHRIYLTPDGMKAPVDEVKKLMSHPSDVQMQGAAIRLFDYVDVLGVAEGIETAIAVTEATGIPCWSVITSTLLPGFIPPSDVSRVIVFADKDLPSKVYPQGAGQEKGRDLVKNLWNRGIKASLAIPPSPIPDGSKSVDWLDEFNAKGREPFKGIVNG